MHEPYYNLVETVTEAKDLIYHSSDYITALIDESEAFAKFNKNKVDSDGIVGWYLVIMEQDTSGARQAVQNWGETSDMNFKQYIEAVEAGEIAVPQE